MPRLPLGPDAQIYIPGCCAGAWLLSHGAMQLGEYLELEGSQVLAFKYKQADTVLLRATFEHLLFSV